jgi:hypothetical protein
MQIVQAGGSILHSSPLTASGNVIFGKHDHAFQVSCIEQQTADHFATSSLTGPPSGNRLASEGLTPLGDAPGKDSRQRQVAHIGFSQLIYLGTVSRGPRNFQGFCVGRARAGQES